ncbi:hypothetical protein Bbelb_049010 [Branchiostoma belcheri]|nr:hypothetical protein Bbelb_049010 [Branchiostoma belcheri]
MRDSLYYSVTVTASVRGDGCQVGYKRLASTCFRRACKPYFACKKEGARLAIPKTEELDIALRNLVRTEGQNGKYWIRLKCQPGENCDTTDVFTWNMGLVIPEVFIRINMSASQPETPENTISP